MKVSKGTRYGIGIGLVCLGFLCLPAAFIYYLIYIKYVMTLYFFFALAFVCLLSGLILMWSTRGGSSEVSIKEIEVKTKKK